VFGLVLIAMACMALTVGSAVANDIYPPPWTRGGPGTATAEWEFNTGANPAQPDGPLTDLTRCGNSTLTQIGIVGSGVNWSTGQWSFPNGGELQITMDNVIDTEPQKDVWLQVTYTGPTPPHLAAITPYPGGSAVGISDGGTPGQYLTHWQIQPNPAWEQLFVIVQPGTTINEVVLDTISAPEPATLSLFALAGVGLVARRIRRR